MNARVHPKSSRVLAALLMYALPVIAGAAGDTTAEIRLSLAREVPVMGGPVFVPIRGRGARIHLAGVTTIDTVANGFGLTLRAVSPGDYVLVVVMDPYKPETLAHTLRAGSVWNAHVNLTTRGSRTVWGRVTDNANKAPLRAAVISINGAAVAAQTDRNGMYRLTDIPHGRRQLRAAAGRFLPDSQDVVVAGGDSLQVNFSLVDTFRPRELVCSVLDAVTGAALSLAAISIPGTPRRVTANRDSLYSMHAISWHPAEIIAEAQGYQTTSLVPGQLLTRLTKLAIPLAPVGWTGVCGVALDAKALEPLVGASISVYSGDSLVAGCAAGRQGLFAVSSLKPGRYKLICSYMGYNDAHWDVEVQTDKARVLLLRLRPTQL